MRLSVNYLLNNPANSTVNLPDAALLNLPEKVLQFGTGVLLRGLPDYLIHKANRQGLFNGRIVVVKSTDGGDLAAFQEQDSLYTLCIRGITQGQTVQENVVCSAISRVLSAKSDWAAVLQVAVSTDLQVVISNTTEVGIQLIDDDIGQTPPSSFPGKLLAVLYARYQAFSGDPARGLVIVPTELIPDNGTKLAAILHELALQNGLDSAFIDWLNTANVCCNSLVDRIVPGLPDDAARQELEQTLGYTDVLLTMTEPFLLWAIEGNERVRAVLSFATINPGVFVQPDIELFRELKVRLLNGSHTLSCGLAHLMSFATVREAMEDEDFSMFVQNLILSELMPGIPISVDEKIAQRFAMDVLDRFRNPYIEHRWLAITVNYSAKIRLRNIPTLRHFYQEFGGVPRYIALGFAAYLLFMRGGQQPDAYPIQDEQRAYVADLWHTQTPDQLTRTVLQNESLWGHDLTALPGFADAVSEYVQQLLAEGAEAVVADLFVRPTVAYGE